MGLLLLGAPFVAGLLVALGQHLSLLPLEVALERQRSNLPLGGLFLQVPVGEGGGGPQHGELALFQAKLSGLEMLFALNALLAALVEVGLNLAVLGTQCGQALLHGSQGHLRRSQFLLAFLPALVSGADLAVCLLQARLQELHLPVGGFGLRPGLLPGLVQTLQVTFHGPHFMTAKRHFFVQSFAALAALADPRS